jgi:hypothetical protein
MAGRPKADIDWERVDELLAADCEGTEIAAHLGLNPLTLYRRCEKDHKINFSQYLQEKKALGNSLLKEQQFKKALGGDCGMLIWLGKNRLNQADKRQQTLEIKDKGTFNISFRNGSSCTNEATDVQPNKSKGD